MTINKFEVSLFPSESALSKYAIGRASESRYVARLDG